MNQEGYQKEVRPRKQGSGQERSIQFIYSLYISLVDCLWKVNTTQGNFMTTVMLCKRVMHNISGTQTNFALTMQNGFTAKAHIFPVRKKV